MELAVTQIEAERQGPRGPSVARWRREAPLLRLLRFLGFGHHLASTFTKESKSSMSPENNANRRKRVRCDDHRNPNPCSAGWPPTTPHMGGLNRIPPTRRLTVNRLCAPSVSRVGATACCQSVVRDAVAASMFRPSGEITRSLPRCAIG